MAAQAGQDPSGAGGFERQIKGNKKEEEFSISCLVNKQAATRSVFISHHAPLSNKKIPASQGFCVTINYSATRNTSSTVVRPSRAFSKPSCTMVIMPFLTATSRIRYSDTSPD